MQLKSGEAGITMYSSECVSILIMYTLSTRMMQEQ